MSDVNLVLTLILWVLLGYSIWWYQKEIRRARRELQEDQRKLAEMKAKNKS